MTSRNDVIVEKRDLHVGGIGTRGSAALSTVVQPMVDPIVDFSDQLVRQARDMARTADDYVHDNPWAAVGVVGLIGLTAGFFLSRRF